MVGGICVHEPPIDCIKVAEYMLQTDIVGRFSRTVVLFSFVNKDAEDHLDIQIQIHGGILKNGFDFVVNVNNQNGRR